MVLQISLLFLENLLEGLRFGSNVVEVNTIAVGLPIVITIGILSWVSMITCIINTKLIGIVPLTCEYILRVVAIGNL
jgi:hypothetical protein